MPAKWFEREKNSRLLGQETENSTLGRQKISFGLDNFKMTH